MGDNIAELKKIFAIACDVYGLNPHQLLHINKSLAVLNDAITNYNKEDSSKYVEQYNILAKLLNSVQSVGNVFKLEEAGQVFDSLHTIKMYLESDPLDTSSENLETSYHFIRMVIIRCFFQKMGFTMEQIENIVAAIDKIDGINLEKNKGVNQLEQLNYLRTMIDHAQCLGKFSLDHVNGIIKVLLDIKKNIVQFNVSEQQKINDMSGDLGTNDIAPVLPESTSDETETKSPEPTPPPQPTKQKKTNKKKKENN